MNTRLATGVGFALFFALALWLPVPGLFALVLALLLSAGIWEWTPLCSLNSLLSRVSALVVANLAFLLMIVATNAQSPVPLQLMMSAFWAWVLVIPLLWRARTGEPIFTNSWLIGLAGFLFLLSTASGLYWLAQMPQGEWRVLLLVGVVATADSCAYFAGKRFGRKPLASELSPHKTFEGVYGGLFGNFVLAVLISWSLRLSPEASLLLFLLIFGGSLLSVAGDLFESAIKRNVGVKDSGSLLPGHGGILDRIDGLMAATPYFVLATALYAPMA